ncbi:glycosyltransferase [Parasaccharibacter apium]|uniref:glycosyltransferase n=1 Tax=Parasaccharibacter apium TaxID=1510841 RepID=UPI0009DA94BD|nr:glycosyltransferase [Parasaccharibacter apium]
MKAHLTVATGLDENNLIPALVTIQSTISNAQDKSRLSFALFHTGLDDHVKQLVKGLLNSYGVAFSLINMPGILSGFTYKDTICTHRLYPLLIPQYFTSRNFVLSIGAGSLIRGDILSLLSDFPTGAKIGAVRCMYHALMDQPDSGPGRSEHHFSRNLLLFNRQAISPEEGQACIQLLDEEWPGRDETILNYLFRHALHLFPQSWNLQMPLFQQPDEAFIPSIRTAITSARNNMNLGQFASHLDPDDMTAALEQTNIHARDYRKIAASLMRQIQDRMPPLLFDPIWTALQNIT